MERVSSVSAGLHFWETLRSVHFGFLPENSLMLSGQDFSSLMCIFCHVEKVLNSLAFCAALEEKSQPTKRWQSQAL